MGISPQDWLQSFSKKITSIWKFCFCRFVLLVQVLRDSNKVLRIENVKTKHVLTSISEIKKKNFLMHKNKRNSLLSYKLRDQQIKLRLKAINTEKWIKVWCLLELRVVWYLRSVLWDVASRTEFHPQLVGLKSWESINSNKLIHFQVTYNAN